MHRAAGQQPGDAAASRRGPHPRNQPTPVPANASGAAPNPLVWRKPVAEHPGR